MRLLHILLLAVACFAVHANGYHHAFHLDDGHVLTENLWVRSLAHVPRYFVDPGTFSSLFANVDYRPVLQVTYALDYALGGYEMPWWHFTQVLLHCLCAVGLYLLGERVVALSGGGERSVARHAPFLAALVFAVHPTASGVVHYQSARSSLLVAALLLPSFLLYMDRPGRESGALRRAGAVLLFALALLVKVEAIAALAVYFLHDVWRAADRGDHARGFTADLLRAALTPATWLRLGLFAAVAAAYFAVRMRLMADFPYAESRRATGVSELDYLRTQVIAWWYYVRNWLAPVALIAHNGAFLPRTRLLDPVVLLAVAGWLAVAIAVLAQWRRRPYLVFLTASALALLSPHSSFMPLAEMVNEHRPYLPLGVLSLAVAIPLGELWAGPWRGYPAVRASAAAVLALGLAALGGLTFERNRAFATEESYWADVLSKAPSAHAHTNYGLALMARGDFEGARRHFESSLELAPYWHITHINLGVLHAHNGNDALALEHYDRAVACDAYSGTALTWRGEHHLARERWREALADFEASMPRSLERYRNEKGAATACAGLGDAQGCIEHSLGCLALDRDQFAFDIRPIATPFFHAERHRAGVEFFERLEPHVPGTWWVHENLALLWRELGETERADRAAAESARLRE